MNARQSDFELLQEFARHGEQVAFTTLARRHLDLVYATAWRKVQEESGAQEVAQNVFAALARKAWQFGREDSLPAWLYKTALLESKTWLRGELRRRRREQTAAELGTTMKTPDDQPAFQTLVPLLDEALLSLRKQDRTALLLRFYENQSLRDVGAALGIGDDAAQKRVAAALGRLTAFFQRRGFKTVTMGAAVAALERTAASAPAWVANSVLVAAGQLTPPTALGLASLAGRLAGWSKAQVLGACMVLAIVPVTWQWNQQNSAKVQLRQAQTELQDVQTKFSVIREQIDRLNTTAARLSAANTGAAGQADAQADARKNFEAWKRKIRSQLLAEDYRWPEDSPFVRIPKSELKHLEVDHPVSQPGEIKRAARELLGLTPAERQQFESALHDHFVSIHQLMEQSIYETNNAGSFSAPASVIAKNFWAIPALGDSAQSLGESLKSTLQNVLGDERWLLVKEELDSRGTDSLRRILSLDADKQPQQAGVWIFPRDGKLLVGYGWSEPNSTFTYGGIALDQFTGDGSASAPEAAQAPDYCGLPSPVTQRMLLWVKQQAATQTFTH